MWLAVAVISKKAQQSKQHSKRRSKQVILRTEPGGGSLKKNHDEAGPQDFDSGPAVDVSRVSAWHSGTLP